MRGVQGFSGVGPDVLCWDLFGNRDFSLTLAQELVRRKWFFPCNDFEVDYESNENASIVYAALAIDKELQPDKVQRQISVINGKLLVHFEAVEARFPRALFSAFVDVLTLETKTIEQFGQGTEL